MKYKLCVTVCTLLALTERICGFLETGDQQGGVVEQLDPGVPGRWGSEPRGDRGEPQPLGLNTEAVCTLSPYLWLFHISGVLLWKVLPPAVFDSWKD